MRLQLKSFFIRSRPSAIGLAYAGTVAVFIWACSFYYLPGKGFTYLIEFGDRESGRAIPELRAVAHYEQRNSSGYDAQYYAQIAMRPHLGDPALRDAVDNLTYRARRILFCWTAYALAGGNAARALHIYAVQNIACWFLLALLLLRWFPPRSWGDWVRWSAVLFSFGLCFSVRASLVDGPSLLFIAAGMALLESNRPWMAAAVLGIAGLGKETNVLSAVAFAPAENTRRAWLGALGRCALALLPLALWILILSIRFTKGGGAGERNFSPPFAGYLGKWAEIFRSLNSESGRRTLGAISLQVALTVQWLFFALRPRWSEPWWRVGAAFAALMIVLGDAVWEGYFSAASRVLLPMTLAFNVLVPRKGAWWTVLVLGNLSLLVSPHALTPPTRDIFMVEGPRALRIVPETGKIVEAVFGDPWYPRERTWFASWRWSRGDATVAFRNPHPFAVKADISFDVRAADRRTVSVRRSGRVYWSGILDPNKSRRVIARGVRLEPGDTTWEFSSDRPAIPPGPDESRPLAFSLRDMTIDLKGRSDGPAP